MPDLRPMEFGEILDGALTLFRRHFGLFFKLSLAVMWLPVALSVYWRVRFLGLTAGSPQQAAALLQSEVLAFSLWALAWGIVYGAGMLVLTASSIRVISDSYLGREPDFGAALGFGVGKIIPLFLVGVGKTLLLIVVGVVCGVIVAVSAAFAKAIGAIMILVILAEGVGAVWLFLFVASGYMVTTPVVVLETLPSAFDSFGRSWELTQGAKRRVFWLQFVAGLIANALPSIVLGAIGGLVTELAPGALLGWTVVAAALPVILTPIVPCILTLTYYDLRVRREGFDLQLLSEQLGTA